MDRLVLEITLAGDDPCDLAVNYGRAWAALEGLMPQAERFFNIRKRSTWIGCDFTARETVVYMGLRMTMPLYRLLGLGLRYGFRVLKEYMNIKKNKAV